MNFECAVMLKGDFCVFTVIVIAYHMGLNLLMKLDTLKAEVAVHEIFGAE